MTNKQHPDQFDWATELLDAEGHVTLSKQEAHEIGARLRRLHVENEALRAERERNLNSICVCNEIINKKNAELESLTTGYAAARLEIESLQARIKTVAEEHADELMVAHLDGRMRAAQPAGAQHPGDCGNTPYDEGPFTLAQQPGAAYAALPDADRDYMRKVVAVAVTMLFDGYKEDVTRVFSPGELSEFVTITAAMGGERVEDIYRRAWDLLSLPDRASHAQAPAQAAPAYKDSTPELHVGDSTFENWYSTYNPAHKGDKQRARDAYAAGMGDPLVTAAPQQEALRLAKYVARRKLAKQLDANEIHSLDSGCDTEAVLLLSDIEAVLAQVAALTATQPAALQQDADEIRSYAAARSWIASASHAPADSVLEGAARLTYEQAHAIRQGHEISASDGYFEARPQIDSNDRRKVFQAGFERGWDAARKQGETMTEPTDALLPCPFCGGAASLHNDTDSPCWFVGCSNSACPIEPCHYADTEAEAIATWNRRTPTPVGVEPYGYVDAARKQGANHD